MNLQLITATMVFINLIVIFLLYKLVKRNSILQLQQVKLLHDFFSLVKSDHRQILGNSWVLSIMALRLSEANENFEECAKIKKSIEYLKKLMDEYDAEKH